MSKYPYTTIRTNRKSIGIRIQDDATVAVHAPLFVSKEEIEAAVNKNENWITAHIAYVQKKKENMPQEDEVVLLFSKAQAVLPKKVKFWGDQMQLHPTKVRITYAQHRFGSCNSQKHICFSYRLMQYPEEAIDYVVVHELAHLVHMNHSRSFYHLVGKYLPDYKSREALLRIIPPKGAGVSDADGEDWL